MQSARPLTVLMVDDQPILGEAVRRMLIGEPDIQFHFCADALKALETAKAVKPTVILQDLVMPGRGGLALVEDYRACADTREIPLIVLSTKEDPAVKVKAFAAGANDYIVKLPDPLELVARIRYHSQGYIHLLERNEAHRELLESREQLAKTNAFVREAFGRYVSNEVVETLLETPAGLKLGGELRTVTILFADIRGFTTIASMLPPEDVVLVINIFLGAMTDVIMKHRGTIVEILGDAIFAVFGAPLKSDDDARRAVACAIEMQLAIDGVNAKNLEEKLPPVSMGIGLHTGDVVAGNVGSMKRAKYGVVGNEVNVASRIESYTVGGQILISERTRADAKTDVQIESSFEAVPKGVTTPLTLHAVIGIGAPYDLDLVLKEEALARLAEPIDLHVTNLDDEGAPPPTSGRLLVASLVELEIETALRPPPHSAVRVVLNGGDDELFDLFGNVLERPLDGGFAVRITSATPEAIKRLARARRSAERV